MSELQDLLVSARIEIERLRAINAVLSAKVETFERCHSFLTARLPDYGQCMGIDVAWELQKEIDRMQKPAVPPELSSDANQQTKTGHL